MFYKFHSLSGRIVPSTQLATYQPQGVLPYAGETSKIIFDSSKTKPLQEAESVLGTASKRATSTSSAAATGSPKGVVPSVAAYQKIQMYQNFFTKDDGLLVWQKRGNIDRFGYLFTMGLVVGGTALFLHQMYRMAMPKKRE